MTRNAIDHAEGASTSPPKCRHVGVVDELTILSCQWTDVFLALMVMPFSFRGP